MSTKEDPYINTRAGVPVNSATVQTGVGLGRETILRLDRLRACYGRSRSFVADLALVSGGLGGIEAENVETLLRFNALAADAGMTWQAYVERYVTTFGSKTYPPTVTQLEEMKWLRVPASERLPRPFPVATGGIVTVTGPDVHPRPVGEEDTVTFPPEALTITPPPAPRGLRDVLGQ